MATPLNASTPATPRERRRNPIAAAVAERYAQTPSYRAFLAEEAERAVPPRPPKQAEAAAAQAEVAARNAQAIAAVQQELLAELELWTAPQTFSPATAEVKTAAPAEPEATATVEPAPARTSSELSFRSAAEESASPHAIPSALSSRAKRSAAQEPALSLSKGSASPAATRLAATAPPVRELSTAGLTVRLYEDLGRTAPALAPRTFSGEQDPEEALALDEEIQYRSSPDFEPFVFEPTTPLPANLLEFPRQLVAARKARPRLAEGPLLEETPRSPQLRIFEVEPEQISIQPLPPALTPEWASIHLGATPALQSVSPMDVAASLSPALSPSLAPPHTAPIGLRLMATVTDLLLVTGSFLSFVAAAAYIAHALPTGIPAAIASASTLAVFYVAYRILFFTFSDQTPGMRYARIGFCTFADENPTRRAIRRRLWAELIALIPFGLGFLWALMDDDHLGWHDRVSRMYPRAY